MIQSVSAPVTPMQSSPIESLQEGSPLEESTESSAEAAAEARASGPATVVDISSAAQAALSGAAITPTETSPEAVYAAAAAAARSSSATA